jgi:hypothetical protein
MLLDGTVDLYVDGVEVISDAAGMTYDDPYNGLGMGSYCISGLTMVSNWDYVYYHATEEFTPADVTPDTTPPTVSIISPTAGQTITGTYECTVSASDNRAVAGVAYYVDGILLGMSGVSPFSWVWDTTNWPSGTHTLKVVAYDNDGNTGMQQVTLTVNSGGDGSFDTGSGGYPSIWGTHEGTFRPKHAITTSSMYTYFCPGTGGHSEHLILKNSSGAIIIDAYWTGYSGSYHYIYFSSVTLTAGETYTYTIVTGSYPQIHHVRMLDTPDGVITCTKFTDANGKVYNDWIPAIIFT